MSGRRVLAGRANGGFSRSRDAVPAPPPAVGVGRLLLFLVGATIPVAALINVLTGCASGRYLAGHAPRVG